MAFVVIDVLSIRPESAWCHERIVPERIRIVAIPMLQTSRVSKFMGPYDVTRICVHAVGNNYRFGAAARSPRAPPISKLIGFVLAEGDPPNNLDVGIYAMHRFQSGCVLYVSRRRFEYLDRAEFEFYIAAVEASEFH